MAIIDSTQNHCDDFDPPRIQFPEVIANEYDVIDERRLAANGVAPSRVAGRPPGLTGLALSGGGVRSATFNLGLLQALADAEKLKAFDYLSTVSGGGYTGGWWSAWLSRAERDGQPGKLFPPREDIESERDDRRARMENEQPRAHTDRPQIKDSAINAAQDPIHHLRLFSNVMTPRKGLLSADSWRAIAVIGRNIILTWMILLPMLLAAIMIGQAWFIFTSPAGENLYGRLVRALYVPGMLFIGSSVCVVFWMLFSRRWQTLGDKVVGILSAIAFGALTWLLITILKIPTPTPVVIAFVLWTVYIVLRLLWWAAESKASRHDGDFWRNRTTLLQTNTLSYSAFALVIFLFAAFGHEAFDFLLSKGTEAIGRAVVKAGGWLGFVLAVASALYTALKAAPTGGGDNPKSNGKTPLPQRLAFMFGPTLMLLVLGIVLSWVGHRLYWLVYPHPDRVQLAAYSGLVSASLFLVFALYEFRPPQRWKSLFVILAWLVFTIVAYTNRPWDLEPHLVGLGVISFSLLAAALVFRAMLRRRLWILFFAAALAAAAIALHLGVRSGGYHLVDKNIARYIVAGALATFVLLLFELLQGRGANTRSIALTVIACTIFVVIGAGAGAAGFGSQILTLGGLISTILGWVLALGWLADPNSLTIHGFYKARLVRAYMGASNVLRGKAREADITDAVPGDDMLLTALRNTERGAPYHLINTMLNLVGSSDLSTQARSSDSFLMSKLFCGSTRTGYRRTSEYACGSISLGTAVAVSGAAASPTMGAQTPSAPLSALMTLFNIRTGFWAPTPSLSYWRSGSARLWPVYTLQELISQTTDLLPYCYLTDGGHYENTAVYSLVQRGCSLIVVSDCGADPRTTLDDLGNMIRKVRIDFDTEIDLDIDLLRKPPQGIHVVIGAIRYGTRHADTLGIPPNERVGTIIVVKPSLAGGETVDVRQYGFLHSDFPQQQTFDLWYDEAQFESYRNLGHQSGKLAIAAAVNEGVL